MTKCLASPLGSLTILHRDFAGHARRQIAKCMSSLWSIDKDELVKQSLCRLLPPLSIQSGWVEAGKLHLDFGQDELYQ